VTKKNRSDTTKRRRRDMTPHYTPHSARDMEEPQSPNTRDSALHAQKRKKILLDLF